MHAKVIENITGGLLDRLHVVYVQTAAFYFSDFAYLEFFSGFYSFKLAGVYCIPDMVSILSEMVNTAELALYASMWHCGKKLTNQFY